MIQNVFLKELLWNHYYLFLVSSIAHRGSLIIFVREPMYKPLILMACQIFKCSITSVIIFFASYDKCTMSVNTLLQKQANTFFNMKNQLMICNIKARDIWWIIAKRLFCICIHLCFQICMQKNRRLHKISRIWVLKKIIYHLALWKEQNNLAFKIAFFFFEYKVLNRFTIYNNNLLDHYYFNAYLRSSPT